MLGSHPRRYNQSFFQIWTQWLGDLHFHWGSYFVAGAVVAVVVVVTAASTLLVGIFDEPSACEQTP